MRTLVWDGPDAMHVEEAPEPSDPGPGELILRPEAVGICGSEVEGYLGHMGNRIPPLVMGHEFAGTVHDVGPQVTRWAVGDRITAPFVCGCGHCPSCEAGDTHVCPQQTQPGFTHFGSWADQIVIHQADANLVAVPEDLPAAAVVGLGCRFATAYHGLHMRAQLSAGETVAVFGCGGVGQSAIMIARALGAEVVAVDVSPAALESARRLGAGGAAGAA